ncbi:MAG: hypothetical protein ACOX4I_00825 [Anaerovoracaceae bacterium]
MKRQEIKRDLTRDYGYFMSQHQIAQAFRIGKPRVRELMADYDFRVEGKNHARRYYVGDVADAICR